MKCFYCEKELPGDKLSRGWKRFGPSAAPTCGDCTREKFCVRAFTIPVAGSMEGTQEEKSAWWKAFRDDLYASWRDTTRLANWLVTRLRLAEPPRTAAQVKMPPQPKTYLYPEARAIVPDLSTGTVTAMEQSIKKRYRARRFKAYWRNDEAFPSYRYPYPLAIRSQDLRLDVREDGRIGISMPIRGNRYVARVRGGGRDRGHKRALEVLRELAAAPERLCEAQVSRRLAKSHRPGGEERPKPSGGRAKVKFDIEVKIVAWMPITSTDGKKGTLHVSTGSDTLWYYAVDDEETRAYHADHLRRIVAGRARQKQRESDDLKFERRRPNRERRRACDGHESRVRGHEDRMDSVIHEATAYLVGYAERRRVAEVVYDDACRDFSPVFPWHTIRERLKYKLEGNGITFTASDDVIDDEPEALAEEEAVVTKESET